jgi:hypothetical protein
MPFDHTPGCLGYPWLTKTLVLVSVHFVLWCGATLGAVPLSEWFISSGFSPKQLLAPGGLAMVETFLHTSRLRLDVDRGARALTWLVFALFARVALLELARGSLTSPSPKRAIVHLLAWLGSRVALGLTMGLGGLALWGISGSAWFGPSRAGTLVLAFGGFSLLALARALDAWWCLNWALETETSGSLFGALWRGKTWLRAFVTHCPRLWASSLGVVLGRVLLFVMLTTWSKYFLEGEQLLELTLLSHLSLLVSLGLELGWYEFVVRIQASSPAQGELV